MKKSQIYVVLPAYNEELSIGKLLTRIKQNFLDTNTDNYTIVVVNDGSKDRTPQILEDFAANTNLKILTHEKNQGLGRTMRDGLQYASEVSDSNDIIITLDADDTHTPGLMPRMMNLIREGHDVIIASRYQKGSRIFGLTFSRKLFSYVASWMFRILLPIKGVKDFTCGYRAYRASVLKDAFAKFGDKFIDQEGFQSMVDIILKLRTMPVIFAEVPFILRYDMKEGDSKMNVNSTIKKTLQLIIKRRFKKI